MKQYHAGQLRFHDFSRLREARSNLSNFISFSYTTSSFTAGRFRFITSPIDVINLPIYSVRNPFVKHHRRFFFSSSFFKNHFENLRLKALERAADRNASDPSFQYEFLSELIKRHPGAVIERFETYPDHSIDERCSLLYFGALQRKDALRDFDLPMFVKRVTGSPNVAGGLSDPLKVQALVDLENNKGKMSKIELAKKAMQIVSGMTSGTTILGSEGFGALTTGGVSGLATRGFTSKNPLHVKMQAPSTPYVALSSFLTLTRHVIIAFVVVSALTALLDEKGMGRAMGLNSKHVQEAEDIAISFDDVKGVDEAKAELEEIVEYLKNPGKFTRLGGKLPRGLLLTGPPGTGKTLLAKAIAGEADVPFFFASGSQFEEVYVGLGAKRVRELFEAAKKKAPSIIFIDEIDAVGGTRKLKDQSALKMTLNELLVQLDGFEENNGIIVVGATNFAEALDSALLRPGRFDKHVAVPLPDVGGRKQILEMYGSKTELSADVDLSVLARGTTGFSGADLYNLMNQAALKASIDGLSSITMSVLEFAKDKILMGSERRTAVITPKTARITAFHEAGHALVATLTRGAQPIHKATIMPRGNSLGMVTMLPEGDQTSQSLMEMRAFMDVAMGGRVAEELIFGEDNITSGAMSDIASASKIARSMVTKYGFSDKVGIVYHGGTTGEESASSVTREKIDNEVKKLTEAAYLRAKELLKKHSKEHHLLAETLLEYETLTGQEVIDVIKLGKKPNRPIVNNENGARNGLGILKSMSVTDATGHEVGSKRDIT